MSVFDDLLALTRKRSGDVQLEIKDIIVGVGYAGVLLEKDQRVIKTAEGA